jgi:NAD(P)-dependent dehydrogenase (short-subunit alcohol dehydrogenase family)
LTPLEPGSVVVSIASGAALAGSPLSGGYAGAKATIRFISAYAGAEARAKSLGVRFVSILPKLTPATNLGAAGAAAYAERAGMKLTDYLDQFGTVLTAEHVAMTVADVVSDDSYCAAAYLLTATELRPLE